MPCTCGSAGFTSTMTTFARDAIAPCQRLLAPKLKYPSESIGRVCTTMKSGGSMNRR